MIAWNPCRGMRAASLAIAFLSVAGGWASGPGDKPAKKIPPHIVKKRDLSKGDTMYVVPYAHLDTQWRWAYPQVIREFVANTLHHNFDLIEKYPHYVFNFSGSRRYEFMRDYYPQEWKQLKAYIKAGRWFPCGSSVDENDANVPSGESLIRHILYGNHFFRREFGIASDEYMLPDCFGFPYALPSILAHCGIKGFSTQKLTWNSANGIPFKVGTWEGPDGKSVVAALDPGGYGSRVDEDLSQNTSWLARIQNTGRISGAFVDYKYYGTGDIGGGPTADSVNWVEKSIAGNGPISVVSSHADEMFNSLSPQQIAKLPHYKGELLLVEHSAGSVSSQAMMKRWNRKNELLAQGAEEASVASMLLGGPAYPADRIYNAWDLVLGSQMHDMLPGTSIPKAYEFCWNDELLAQNQFAAIETSGIGAVTSAMDTSGSGSPLVVYNPLSVARTDVVQANLPWSAQSGVQVVDAAGKPVPTQVLRYSGDQAEVLFVATVPATGIAVFHARSAPSIRQQERAGRSIANARLKVTVDKEGDIASIYDNTSKREVLKSPVRLAFQYENPKQFPAWNMDWEDQQKPPRGYVEGPAKISIIENGPVRWTIRVERETDGSKFVQDISLTRGGQQVEVMNHIDWQSKECALKATIPLAAGNPKATYDLQVGAIVRGNDNPRQYEVPSHQWFDLTDPKGAYGAAILNDSKYGSDKPDDNTLRLTLIYTPGTRGGFGDQSTQDIGRHDILFAIAPHAGSWQKAQVPWQAKRLNQPLRAYVVPPHSGPLGRTFSLFSTNSSQVEIQAIKKDEDNGNVIVRLRELTGKPAKGLRLTSANPILAAWQTDGQERRLGKIAPTRNSVVVDVPGFSLKTLELKMKPRAVARTPISRPVKLAFDTDVASTDKNPTDGFFDRDHALSAEQLPAKITVDGIDFFTGPTADGAKNAVAARGQKIPLPAGYDQVFVLAAASGGDMASQFRIGTKDYPVTVQSWSGYVGQWDNRLWASDPGPNFTNYTEMSGLVPGYVKPAEVAWFANHNHTAQGNTFYEYSYLYKLSFAVPRGATSITLPNNPAVKVLAISVGKDTHADVRAAAPLYDQLKDHIAGGKPSILASGSFSDAMQVRIDPPLYWRGGGLRYTLDGSTPTASSKVYDGPFTLSDPTTVKAVEIDANGHPSQITSVVVNVHDSTPPRVLSASGIREFGIANLQFSETIDKASAEDPANYGPSKVSSARLGQDGKTVELTFAQAGADSITVVGVRDRSKAGNPMPPQTVSLENHGAVLSQATFEPRTAKVLNQPGLPVKAASPWTLNLWCKIDQRPEDRTIIAGFGRATDGRTGTGRYLCQFPNGISFWAANADVYTTTPLDLGRWQMLTATYDGATLKLYKNGDLIGSDQTSLEDDSSIARIMPVDAWEHQRRFDGEVRDFTIWDVDLPASVIKQLAAKG